MEMTGKKKNSAISLRTAKSLAASKTMYIQTMIKKILAVFITLFYLNPLVIMAAEPTDQDIEVKDMSAKESMGPDITIDAKKIELVYLNWQK